MIKIDENNIYIFNLNPERIFGKNLIINIIIWFKKITYDVVVGVSNKKRQTMKRK